MTGMRSKAGLVLMLVGTTALAGCDSLGSPLEAFSQKKSGPDEFAVLKRKPLQMPTDRSLPVPRLGETSAVEPDPEREAIEALLGPGAATNTAAPTAGEQALLAAAKADANSDIRVQLQQDAVGGIDEGPYEAPTLVELFSETGQSPEELINPAEESQRLQAEGIAPAPIDPLAVPAQEQRRLSSEDVPRQVPLQPKKGT